VHQRGAPRRLLSRKSYYATFFVLILVFKRPAGLRLPKRGATRNIKTCSCETRNPLLVSPLPQFPASSSSPSDLRLSLLLDFGWTTNLPTRFTAHVHMTHPHEFSPRLVKTGRVASRRTPDTYPEARQEQSPLLITINTQKIEPFQRFQLCHKKELFAQGVPEPKGKTTIYRADQRGHRQSGNCPLIS